VVACCHAEFEIAYLLRNPSNQILPCGCEQLKALGLFKQIAPAVTRIGFLFNPNDYPYYEGLSELVQGAARGAGARCDGI
jgi:hypothetical protein